MSTWVDAEANREPSGSSGDPPVKTLNARARRAVRVVLSMFFVTAGIGHFTHEAAFVSIVPEYLPAPRMLVWISGVAEIAGGVGLMFDRTRRVAAWGLIALLIAVFPANMNMAMNPRPWLDAPAWTGLHDPDPVGLYLRLPLQVVFVFLVGLFTRRPS
jgi:uncharacterized membrane protein